MRRAIVHRIALGLLAPALAACSVMSANMREQADTTKGYQDLVQHPAESVGKDVILGGYVLEVTNRPEKTILNLLQAPLDFQDRPGQRDRSAGRLIVEYPGFLDPAVYVEDRKVTVGGRILEASPRGTSARPYPYLRIAAAELHLWPQPKPYDPYDPWWPYPHHHWYHDYPWHHPYHRHGHW